MTRNSLYTYLRWSPLNKLLHSVGVVILFPLPSKNCKDNMLDIFQIISQHFR